MLNRSVFFYDGRANSLEEQALMPIENAHEMGLPVTAAVERLNKNPGYKKLFQKIFNEDPNRKNLATALAVFERTLETVNSKFDDWSYNKRKKWTASEERGRLLFTGEKAKCFNCHNMEDFTNDDFKNIGLFNGKEWDDSGRALISGKAADVGKFKTPGLRNIGVTAPYMHNGKFKTLEAVVDYYNEPKKYIADAVNSDTDLQQPLGLTPGEKADLVAFLKTLTDRRFLKKTD
jgi:cytochrome c peroxidase